jgi:hypothetical protein
VITYRKGRFAGDVTWKRHAMLKTYATFYVGSLKCVGVGRTVAKQGVLSRAYKVDIRVV